MTKVKATKKTVVIDTASIVEDKPKKSRKKNYKEYQERGLLLTRESSDAESVKVVYSGLLAQKGAADVFVRAGVGEQWENTQDIKMSKTPKGEFETTLPADKKIILNLCFHNEKDDWDNNDNHNYSYSVS